MSQPARTGHPVTNFDAVWGDAAEPRWFHVGKPPHRVSLGRNGVPQALVVYALCGAGLALVLSRLPVLSVLISWPSGWVAGAAVTALFALAALLRPNGLRVHVFLPILLADRLGPRHTLGWKPLADPTAPWQPTELVLSDPEEAA